MALHGKYSNYRYCINRDCKNTSIKTPEKLWIRVPIDKDLRNTWLKLANRDPESISPSSRLYLCEDHFDLKNDMENYTQYQIMRSVKQIKLKPNCVPSRFSCQIGRKHKLSQELSTVSFQEEYGNIMSEEEKVFTTAIKRKNIVKNNLYDLISKEDDLKVFCSSIERGGIAKNNLYELIETKPVEPLKPKHETEENIDFNYDKEKCYISKRYSKFTSVKTVNSIRSELEKDMYEHLLSDLEKQDNFLLKKIRYGYSKDQKTINIAKKIMDCGRPLYRSTLQMISNINPNKHNHPTQYVLFNGSYIRVSGSLGGNRKFVCNFDLGKRKINKCHRFGGLQKNSDKKKLLIKSLLTKFKPGPLTKKSTLDESYQKFNVGAAEIVKLPDIGLNVQPCLGLPIEPTICDILSILHKDDIHMSKTWAEYSVSTLYSNDNSKNKGITFPLPYKNNQKCIMMRRDTENVKSIEIQDKCCTRASDEDTEKEITDILDKIIDSVEISLNQDTMYTSDDDQRIDDTNIQLINTETVQNTKRNEKNKCYSFKELERLDVTVIRLADTTAHESIGCSNKYCLKGCVCASINAASKFIDHCGRVGCMFECKCNFSKYKVVNCIDDSGVEGYLPGIYNLDTEINSKLAKEEKKFHQTIVVTDEKRIILKSHKRNLKTPKRYVEYYEGKEGSKRQSSSNKILTISLVKLPDTNIEPWCMVHNLYKCFCKGIFTERSLQNVENVTIDHDKEQEKVKQTNHRTYSNRVKPGVEKPVKISTSSTTKVNSDITLESEPEATEYGGRHRRCARTIPFAGQKFDSSFYKKTHGKIRSMEQNDLSLKNKFNRIANSSSESERHSPCVDVQFIQNESLDSDNETEKSVASNNSEENNFLTPGKKSKLISWLNVNYKHYKEMLAQGNNTILLKAPSPGKLALYPWEVIRDRYTSEKNFFLVTKDPPHRLFMAVHKNHSFFKNCIPINQIPFMELRKYPISVRNLIDGTCYVSDNFYILGGLAHCWEIIGSVTKVNDIIPSPGETQDNGMNFSFNDEINSEEKFQSVEEQKYDVEMSVDLNQKQSRTFSKWFVMTIENDFSEIQFHKKGFFVKFDIIIRAIKVSRSTKKTVRLSSTKSNETDSPQFGIYAVPEMNKHCVFIGPYEMYEALGFGIIAKPSHNIKTTGYWISTEKVDNYRVIDDPLSFFKSNAASKKVPRVSNRLADESEENCSFTHIEEEIKIENNELPNSTEQIKEEPVKNDIYEIPAKKPRTIQSVKVIKPITIKKSQSLLNLNTLKNTISFVANKIPHSDINLPIPIIKETFSLANTDKQRLFGDGAQATTSKPIAEIAPQPKQSSINTETEGQAVRRPIKPEGGMFILKPEEINQRLLGHQVDVKVINDIPPDDPMHTDIEDFLATSKIVLAADVLEISDEEPELLEPSEPEYKQVWIEPVAIQNLGWIPGRRNNENQISFEFPGFKYTAFYPQHEALHKILQVLSRKVYVPKLFPVKWRIVDSPDQLITKEKMEASDLGADMVLTKSGLKHKADLVNMRNKLLNIKTQVVTDI